MLFKKKLGVIGALFAVITVSAAAIEPPPTNDYKNLKVLPKDITSKNLQQIMVDEFQDGLGVSCNYCHAQEKGSLHLDYASDEKPEKEIARSMMQMTMDINKKYFNVLNPAIGDTLMLITCGNCHHGNPQPPLGGE
jgi:Photosynthetic reaction centre cytochrome C subunit